jgi:hypothetical protein
MSKYSYRWYMVIEQVEGVVLALHRLLSGYHWDLLEVVWDLFISYFFRHLLINQVIKWDTYQSC